MVGKITAKPSTVRYPNGMEVRLDELAPNEAEHVKKQMTEAASKGLSAYYTQNRAEWSNFAKEA